MKVLIVILKRLLNSFFLCNTDPLLLDSYWEYAFTVLNLGFDLLGSGVVFYVLGETNRVDMLIYDETL